MVHAHLRHRALTAPPVATDDHLDEDSLSAFTEGRLNEYETQPVLKHLVACSFCRHITAQLVRLDSELGESKIPSPVIQDDPGRIRRLLDDLSSRVFVSDDEAVFAYHVPADDFEKENAHDAATDEESKSDSENSEGSKPDES